MDLDPVRWDDGVVRIVDQTALPHDLRTLDLRTVDEVIAAIRTLAVRGAPAIGACGAFGVALAAHLDTATAPGAAARIAAARPTAVNLRWAVERVAAVLPEGPAAALAEATAIRAETIAASEAMARRGAELVADLVDARPISAHTHCNTGPLACLGRGTALAVVHELFRRDLLAHVLVDETRPLLQGSRLTAFELGRWGIPYEIVVDGAAPALLAAGHSHVVLVGADRIAANGDVANKIGTFGLALAARHAGLPFVVVAPESTIDLATATGADIAIELRDAAEVLAPAGVRAAPPGAAARNVAFDVTPAELVSAIVTEHRVVHPVAGAGLPARLPNVHRDPAR